MPQFQAFYTSFHQAGGTLPVWQGFVTCQWTRKGQGFKHTHGVYYGCHMSVGDECF